ncbi:hypothetical protein TWF970_003605 [Orbilia oligospora]|uniref:Uncharacterized protein n=1 Tax=Orbilia oligospora TaxID=2813651 RepID=A0A7C8RM13_ORBOL|nr:hypothetical protein TWF970_003605 [Orbilia oligospora]
MKLREKMERMTIDEFNLICDAHPHHDNNTNWSNSCSMQTVKRVKLLDLSTALMMKKSPPKNRPIGAPEFPVRNVSSCLSA